MNKRSITQALQLAEQAAANPELAARLRETRARFGDTWDPQSVLAKRLRAIRYAGSFLDFMRDAEGSDASPAPYFEAVRELLATHCDPKFEGLATENALALLKPERGPEGAAGTAGRWSALVGAFGDNDAEVASKRFRQAVRDSRPARLARER